MKTKQLFLSLMILGIAVSCGAKTQNQPKTMMKPDVFTAKEISSSQAQALIQRDSAVQILDVRTPEEFAMGHVPNAQNIDIHSADFEQKILQLNKHKTCLVYCRTHHRSGIAVDFMLKNKFESVYQMMDGFTGWQAQNLPVKQ